MSMCRLCLSCDTNISELSDIYGTRLHDILEKLTGILMFQGDGLPHTICSMCKSYLNKSYQLWKRSTTANKILTMMQASQMEITPEVVRQIDRQGYQLCYNYKPFYPPGVNCLDNELIVTEETQNQDDSIQTEVFEPTIVTEAPQATELETVEGEVSKDTNCQEDEETPDETELPEEAHSQEEPEFEETFEVQEEQETQDQPEAPEAAEDDDSDHRPPSGKETSVVNEIPMEIDLTEADLPAAPKAKRKNAARRDCGIFGIKFPNNMHMYKCTTVNCKYKTNNKSDFQNHLRKHTGERPFQCTLCIFKTTNPKTLRVHTKAHTGEKQDKNNAKLKCSLCKYRTNSKYALNLHFRIHTGEKPEKCDLCEKRFRNRSNLRRHISTVHNNNYKPYKCTICLKAFPNGEYLTKHLVIHSKEPIKCELCDFVTNTKPKLKYHLLVHTSEYKHKCTLCDYKTVHKMLLVKHMRSHGVISAKVKYYECDKCTYKTMYKQNLDIHMLTHTGEKPFQCAVCGFSCNRKDNLEKHARTHTGERPFRCTSCDFKSANRSNLNLHIKKQHKYTT